MLFYQQPPFYSRELSVMYDAILHRPLEFRNNSVGSQEARSILEAVSIIQRSEIIRIVLIMSETVSYTDKLSIKFLKLCGCH